MGLHRRLTGWALLTVAAVSGRLASRNYRRLPILGAPHRSISGHVSIIIPARNEAERLPELLKSLAKLDFDSYEVVVVNDASSDGTAEVAAAFRVQVLPVGGPPTGWTGKSFACWRGAQETEGDWILFTDADTIHGPASLQLALAAAAAADAGLVSLLARQRCETFWERLLLPYAYALYFVGVIWPNRSAATAIANGQYMLFRRVDYERIGSHAAVRASIVEDVALARLALEHGVRVLLLRGEKQLEVRMYRNIRELWEGFSKNAFRFVSASPGPGALTVIASISWSSVFLVALRCRSRPLALALLLTPAVELLPWEQRFGVPRYFAFLYPLAATVFQLLALDSIRQSTRRGATMWKGRSY